ncbi:hypothetical protein DQ04_15381010, partial [Trypanosoma grayi]|uniref:hypothetical protein n=1 Tax=Trypanosoma grayi TaxID=71804 RepID=UPI0004F43178
MLWGPAVRGAGRLVTLLLLLLAVGAAGHRGFSGEIPAEPYDTAYHAYFRNYPSVRPCILGAAVTAETSGSVDNRRNDSDAYWGCKIGSNAVTPHTLLLLTAAEVAQMLLISDCGAN